MSQRQSPHPSDLIEDRWPAFLEDARALAEKSREAFREIRRSSNRKRSTALLHLAEALEKPDVQKKIIKENAVDLEAAKQANLSPALQDRLSLDKTRILAMGQSLREIAAMRDPVGEVLSGETLASGVEMVKKRVPLGVVFTIYESRPNVTVDIGALSVKSGNAAILRGGKEARHSNRILHSYFVEALKSAGLPENSVQFVSESDRAFMLACLKQDDLIDIVVPRGGEALIRFTAENSRIPVIKHDTGVCNLYIDKEADPDKAEKIAINAKLQRPSVCNAIENLLIHKDYPHTSSLLEALSQAGARLLGDAALAADFPQVEAVPEEKLHEVYDLEFLDERLAVRTVADIDEALDFIHKYGSGHSEAIVTENIAASHAFAEGVDTAAIFINCSTRFHDGGQMGMGAEVGISTGRLHVRGPMGLSDLTTTSYLLSGDGTVRS